MSTPKLLNAVLDVYVPSPPHVGPPIACGCWDGVNVALNYSPTSGFPDRWQGTQSICGGRSVTLTFFVLGFNLYKLELSTDACIPATQTLFPEKVPDSDYCASFLAPMAGDCCRPPSGPFPLRIHIAVPSGPCPTPRRRVVPAESVQDRRL